MSVATIAWETDGNACFGQTTKPGRDARTRCFQRRLLGRPARTRRRHIHPGPSPLLTPLWSQNHDWRAPPYLGVLGRKKQTWSRKHIYDGRIYSQHVSGCRNQAWLAIDSCLLFFLESKRLWLWRLYTRHNLRAQECIKKSKVVISYSSCLHATSHPKTRNPNMHPK